MASPILETVPNTGRDLDTILRFHDLEPGQFAGKIVLDQGCGYSDLGADLSVQGVQTHVLGLDANMRQCTSPPRPIAMTQKVLAHLGEPLPLPDESVDMVLATYSYPIWAQQPGQLDTYFEESWRVLKPGGLWSAYPMSVSTARFGTEEGRRDWEVLTRAMRRWRSYIEQSPQWQSTSTDFSLMQVRRLG